MRINVQQKSQRGSVTLKDLFTRSEYLKPTLIMFVIMICRQMTGVNYVTFYLNDIFIKADTGFSSELQSTIVSAVSVSREQHILCHHSLQHFLPSSGSSSGTCPCSCREIREKDTIINLSLNMLLINEFAWSLLLP